MRALLLLVLASCVTTPAQPAPDVALATDTAEGRHWATEAALLDPRAYVLTATNSGWLDVTVPEDETWYAVNTFAVHFNEPVSFTQDTLYPLTRRMGFLRTLDSRRNIGLTAGTRIRSNPGVAIAYVYYANPSIVWALDERYQTDPRGLYYERLDRLRTLPIQMVTLETRSGGSIDDLVRVNLPDDFESAMLISASVYDSCWVNLGILNVANEINNTHTVRFAETMLAPFRRDGIGGAHMTLKKGSYSDGSNNGDPPLAFPIWSSTDPAHAYPIKGSGNILYQVLPEGW